VRDSGSRWVLLARCKAVAAAGEGGQELVSEPFPSRSARTARLSAWMTGTASAKLEESRDKVNWVAVAEVSSNCTRELSSTFPVGLDWLRMRLGVGVQSGVNLEVHGLQEAGRDGPPSASPESAS